ncbi:MAG: hypothetical protein SOZ52_01995 [Pyramidobacter sp.]|nr:hypothetical protein [Pyramidobacter sp.]
MKIQITLSAEAGKRLIIQAVLQLPQVQTALQSHQLIIKGGTTASIAAETLCGTPLKICGRLTAKGAGTLSQNCSAPHSILLKNGEVAARDAEIWDGRISFSRGDVCIIGANIVDRDGRAAMLSGSPLGNALHFFTALPSEGVEMIVAAGLEKWAPCSLDDAMSACSRSGFDLSMGMPCGLIPIPGKVIDETEACRILGASDVQIIARGGICGGEGGCTLAVTFDDEDAGQAFFQTVQKLSRPQNQAPAGSADSLTDCLSTHCAPSAALHSSCWYRAHRNEV